MLKNLQNFARFQKFQLNNLVDFEKCCKMRIYLRRSAPIQPKTSEILPKICQNFATTLRVPYGAGEANQLDHSLDTVDQRITADVDRAALMTLVGMVG